MEHHPFDPIVFEDSQILILGSFPSLKSFEANFYYAHPRNQFWPLLAALFGEKADTKQERISLCKKHRIALWDAAKSLKRETGNSSDANLTNIIPNDFGSFLKAHPTIEKIFFTGRKAQSIYNAHFKDIKIEKALLPSPSPAYAAMRFEAKLEKYRELLGDLRGA